MTTTPTDNVRVTIDGENAFPAYDGGARWNGFVCPTFTRETAEQVVVWNEATLSGPDDSRLSWDGDTVVIHVPAYAHETDYAPERVGPDAHGRYPIGAWSWVWMLDDDLTSCRGYRYAAHPAHDVTADGLCDACDAHRNDDRDAARR